MMYNSAQKGFTLVEMIVSVGIFAMVMLVATSAYYNLINLDRRARATNEVVNNISFAMEAMTRGIRTGTNYRCNSGTTVGVVTTCTCFTYDDSNLAVPVTYHLNSSKHVIERAVNSTTCTDGAPAITDPLINISTLKFYLRGDASTDDFQPQVRFTVKGDMPTDARGGVATFVIEEGATQRVLDL